MRDEGQNIWQNEGQNREIWRPGWLVAGGQRGGRSLLLIGS